MKQGSRGSDVKSLQEQLKAAGFDPGPIDGIFGPKTAAAVRAFQQDRGLTVDGIAGTETMAEFGHDAMASSISSDPGDTDYTDDPLTRFNGLPGEPEIWRDSETGEIYAMYTVPGDPPIPLLYTIPSEEVLATYFGDKDIEYDREMPFDEMSSYGTVVFGDVGELKDVDGDPWAGFEAKMDRAKKVMPWLNDPEVFAIFASAYVENREIEDWELKGVGWFSGKTDEEIAWATKLYQDPEDAERFKEDNLSKVHALFADMGISAPPALAEYIADMWTTGRWSQTYAEGQITKVTGGGETVELDADLASYMTEEDIDGDSIIGTTGVDRVKELFAQWLGPAYMPTDEEIATWAGRVRDDATGGESRLVEHLRGQRMALFPEYEDSTLTWQDISAPWKSRAAMTWGVEVDETDPEFQKIVKLNDAVEADKEMRRIGVERGYEGVVSDMIRGMESGMRRNVRGAV